MAGMGWDGLQLWAWVAGDANACKALLLGSKEVGEQVLASINSATSCTSNLCMYKQKLMSALQARQQH
jgi:hypothetical protein